MGFVYRKMGESAATGVLENRWHGVTWQLNLYAERQMDTIYDLIQIPSALTSQSLSLNGNEKKSL